MQTATKTPPILAAVSLLASTIAFAGGYRTQVGYDQLSQEFGAALPDGSNLVLMQVEAPDTSGAWASSATGEVSGGEISYPYSTTIPTKFSGHANIVAVNLVGNSTSLLPGAPTLLCSGASMYRNSSLGIGKFSAPVAATWDVENHSYAGNATTYNTNALQLLDFRIARDLTTVVVALENGTGAVPPLFGNTYNTITVGVSSGAHSRGGTTLEGSGRLKPDLVAPASFTSYATPMVASAAGLLISEAKRTTGLAAAKDPRVIKALLLAGATKDEFPGWAATPASPLDPVYGAGELHIGNAYRILRAGRQSTGNALRPLSGWDCGKTTASSLYFFQVPAGQTLDLTAALTWHRTLTTDDYWSFTATLPDLALRLRQSSAAFAKGAILAESNSPIDNVEHLWRTALSAGYYALEVSGPVGITYGLAWRGVSTGAPVPVAPTATALPTISTSSTTQIISSNTTDGAADALIPAAELLRAETHVGGTRATALRATISISGRSAKHLLVRGIGSTFGRDGIARPVLSISAVGSNRRLAYNDSWQAGGAARLRAAAIALGAAPLAETSRDAAMLVALPPGTYNVSLYEKEGHPGRGRLELLDAGPDPKNRVQVLELDAAAPAADLGATLSPAVLPATSLVIAADDNTATAPQLSVVAGSCILAKNSGWSQAQNAADIATSGVLPTGTDMLPPEDWSAVLLAAQRTRLKILVTPISAPATSLTVSFGVFTP